MSSARRRHGFLSGVRSVQCFHPIIDRGARSLSRSWAHVFCELGLPKPFKVASR